MRECFISTGIRPIRRTKWTGRRTGMEGNSSVDKIRRRRRRGCRSLGSPSCGFIEFPLASEPPTVSGDGRSAAGFGGT